MLSQVSKKLNALLIAQKTVIFVHADPTKVQKVLSEIDRLLRKVVEVYLKMDIQTTQIKQVSRT